MSGIFTTIPETYRSPVFPGIQLSKILFSTILIRRNNRKKYDYKQHS